MDEDDLEIMTPEQVRALAERAERASTPSGFAGGLIGVMVEEDEGEAGIMLPDRRPPKLKTYCEDCGHVDSHAVGCPAIARAEAMANLEELDREEAIAEQQDKAEPILPLVRRIGASLLRRVARRLEGAD